MSLVAAYIKGRQTRAFTCPITGVELVMLVTNDGVPIAVVDHGAPNQAAP